MSSCFDARITVNQNQIAVTMVQDKETCHTRLVFEGVDGKGQQRFRVVHFYPEKFTGRWDTPWLIFRALFGQSERGIVDAGKGISGEKLDLSRYSKKTQTWAITKEQMEGLLSKQLSPKDESFKEERSIGLAGLAPNCLLQ